MVATNTIGANGLVSRNTSSGSTFYAFDALGSTGERLSSSGSAVSDTITDAFGAVSGTVSSDPFSRYNSKWGYVNDPETGMQLLGHRFYDQATGRFINRDPVGIEGGINVYAYTGNGAVEWEDPSGHGYQFPPTFEPVGGWGLPYVEASPWGELPGTGAGERFWGGIGGGLIGGGIMRRLPEPEFPLPGGGRMRLAPAGNKGNNPFGKWPHYHRSVPDPSSPGNSMPGQGIGRHRPWECKSTDKSFWDRF